MTGSDAICLLGIALMAYAHWELYQARRHNDSTIALLDECKREVERLEKLRALVRGIQ